MKDKVEISMRKTCLGIGYYEHARVFLEIQFHKNKLTLKVSYIILLRNIQS